MKTIIFAALFAICAGSTAQAQFLKNLTEKAKTALDEATNRTQDKIVDRAVNNPIDNTVDNTLDKAEKKVNSVFRKKNKKNDESEDPEQTATPQDSIAIRNSNQNIDQ
ncbi:MAG: hypothetical protein WBF83_01780 [Moheibacter sp.]